MDEYEERQREIAESIAASPVVGKCVECGDDIRQGEIDFGTGNERQCSRCVHDEVMSMIGDY